MNRDDTRENTRDDPLLAAAWALDALDDDERAGYEERLRTHPDERADADALRETASRLSVATTPPPHLRASVLAAVAATPQEQPQEQPRERPRDQAAAPVVDLADRRDRRRGPSRRSALVAAAGILVGAVGVGVGVAGRTGGSAVSAQQEARDRITELLTRPGVQVSTVGASGGGTATLVRADGEVGVLTSGLPAAGSGRGYQLWLAEGEDLTSAGMLPVTSSGGSAVVVAAGAATGVGISVEPAGGSQQPTTDPVVFAPLPA